MPDKPPEFVVLTVPDGLDASQIAHAIRAHVSRLDAPEYVAVGKKLLVSADSARLVKLDDATLGWAANAAEQAFVNAQKEGFTPLGCARRAGKAAARALLGEEG